jgi:hypothetical protein
MGSNVGLPAATANGLNIGNVLYGLNLYSAITEVPASNTPTATGRIGIRTQVPLNTLHITSEAANTSGLRFQNLTSASPDATGAAIGVDANGDVVRIASGGGSTYTVDNGLTENVAGNFQLGGTLIKNTDIFNQNLYSLFIRDVVSPNTSFIEFGAGYEIHRYRTGSFGSESGFELYKGDSLWYSYLQGVGSSTNEHGESPVGTQYNDLKSVSESNTLNNSRFRTIATSTTTSYQLIHQTFGGGTLTVVNPTVYVPNTTQYLPISVNGNFADNSGNITIAGGGVTSILGYVEKTAIYTFNPAADYTVNCTGNTFNLTLPSAVGITGQIFVAKNTGVGIITLDTTSSQTIDGTLTVIINQYEAVKVQSRCSFQYALSCPKG